MMTLGHLPGEAVKSQGTRRSGKMQHRMQQGIKAMIRAFTALALPDHALDRLEQFQQTLPLHRVVPRENLHITLAFLDTQPEIVLEELHHELQRLRAPGFAVGLRGVGAFGGARPRNIHAAVEQQPLLHHLQAKVEAAARSVGMELPARRYVPHVTLARLGAGRFDRPRLERALAAAADFFVPAWEVESFGLYRSHLGRDGANYELLASYRLLPQG